MILIEVKKIVMEAIMVIASGERWMACKHALLPLWF